VTRAPRLQAVTQDGEKKRFYSELLKDHLVVVSLFCTDRLANCPVVNRTVSRVQEELDTEFGEKYFFVSMTLDPANGTPEVLARRAIRYAARPGWSFVTGAPANQRTIAAKLGQRSAYIAMHPPEVHARRHACRALDTPAGQYLAEHGRPTPATNGSRIRSGLTASRIRG